MEAIRQMFSETSGRMRRLFFNYGVSAILLILTLSGAILMKKYTDSLYATFDRLQEFNVQHIKVRAAIDDIEKTTARLKSLLPQTASGQLIEEPMLIALDDLKTKAGTAEITVANIEDKGADIQLPVTIRSPLKDYTSLVHFVGYLQSLKFPFFGITGIKIQKSEDTTSTMTTFEIKGALKYPKTSSPTQATETKRIPGKL
jgi:hypothetical protein